MELGGLIAFRVDLPLTHEPAGPWETTGERMDLATVGASRAAAPTTTAAARDKAPTGTPHSRPRRLQTSP